METLIYYSIYNPDTGKYLGYDHHDRMLFETNLRNSFMFDSINNAKLALKEYSHDPIWQIRKVKKFDLGEVDA